MVIVLETKAQSARLLAVSAKCGCLTVQKVDGSSSILILATSFSKVSHSFTHSGASTRRLLALEPNMPEALFVGGGGGERAVEASVFEYLSRTVAMVALISGVGISSSDGINSRWGKKAYLTPSSHPSWSFHISLKCSKPYLGSNSKGINIDSSSALSS